MTTIVRALLLAGLLSYANATSTDAQTRGHHLWWGLAMDYGWGSFSCDVCEYRRVTGTNSTQLDGWGLCGGFGWTSNRHVRVGLEYRGWLNGLKGGDSLPGLDIGQLFFSYSPRIRTGLFVEGAGAFTHYTLGLGTGDPIEPHKRVDLFAAGYGWGYGFGVGWQSQSGFTPRLIYLHCNEHRLHTADGSTVATGWKQNMLFIEIGYRTP